jgi:hypothetical protein
MLINGPESVEHPHSNLLFPWIKAELQVLEEYNLNLESPIISVRGSRRVRLDLRAGSGEPARARGFCPSNERVTISEVVVGQISNLPEVSIVS